MIKRAFFHFHLDFNLACEDYVKMLNQFAKEQHNFLKEKFLQKSNTFLNFLQLHDILFPEITQIQALFQEFKKNQRTINFLVTKIVGSMQQIREQFFSKINNKNNKNLYLFYLFLKIEKTERTFHLYFTYPCYGYLLNKIQNKILIQKNKNW